MAWGLRSATFPALRACKHSTIARSCKDGGFTGPVPSRLWAILCLWHILRHANYDGPCIELWRKVQVFDIFKFGKLSSLI